jgi:hypothetical protein
VGWWKSAQGTDIRRVLINHVTNIYTNIYLGITSSGMTFSIGFCFLPGETQQDFTWVFQCFKELGISPGVVVIDGDQAQKNASEAVFPYTPTLLCV